jgi:Sodium/hydrogen exchanger family
MSLSRVLRRLQDTTAQIRVRAAFLLMIGFTAVAEGVGFETILGAFAAGAVVSLLDRDETAHPQFRVKLEEVGFGVFIPLFFVTSGLRFDLSALFASSSTIARVPLFLLAILLGRGLPALVYVPTLGLSRSLIAGCRLLRCPSCQPKSMRSVAPATSTRRHEAREVRPSGSARVQGRRVPNQAVHRDSPARCGRSTQRPAGRAP